MSEQFENSEALDTFLADLDRDLLLTVARNLSLNINAEWQDLGGYNDTEIIIRDAHQTLTSPTAGDLDIDTAALAFKLGKLCNNGYGKNLCTEAMQELRADERFTEAVDWHDEYIGYDVADNIQILVRATVTVE